MALPVSNDILIGLGAIAVGAFAIYMFIRATGGISPDDKGPSADEPQEAGEPVEPIRIGLDATKKVVKVPQIDRVAKGTEVEKARSTIRTLSLKQEITSMVMKRLFEAEDEEEITREERISLSKGYETEMKEIDEELKQAELIVSLNELEAIRSDIISQFEETLNDTQQRIDIIIKELGIQPPKEEAPEAKTRPPRRRRPRPVKGEEPEEEEAEEEEGEPRRRSRQDVEERLDKLKKDVLKELEELDRLELEA